MRIVWSAFAVEDREAIFDYIAADNPAAAAKLDRRIDECIESLARFSESGRPGREPATRELVVTGTPYLAVYRVDGEVVRILRVLHGPQLWPER